MDVEPHPIEKGAAFWELGCSEWLERYEYIEARAERYFDAYRDDPMYDFTKTGAYVLPYQKAVSNAYEEFAAGRMSVLGVQAQVKMLRGAFKKREATPLTPEERAKANEKPEYVPKWKREWEAKKFLEREAERKAAFDTQPRADAYDRFIPERLYRGERHISPMEGLNCCSYSHNEGFLSDGSKVKRSEAYIQMLWDLHEKFYPEKPGRPDSLIPGYEAPKIEAPAEKKTLDDLKADKLKNDQAEASRKLDKRLRVKR